jgi:hypothetical protein
MIIRIYRIQWKSGILHDFMATYYSTLLATVHTVARRSVTTTTVRYIIKFTRMLFVTPETLPRGD